MMPRERDVVVRVLRREARHRKRQAKELKAMPEKSPEEREDLNRRAIELDAEARIMEHAAQAFEEGPQSTQMNADTETDDALRS